MKFQKGEKVTLSDEAKLIVKDPTRYNVGVVACALSNGMVEVMWNGKTYPVCMQENEITKLHKESQISLF